MTGNFDKPGFPNEHLDMLKHVQVDYWYEADLDRPPDVFISEVIGFFAENCQTLQDFTLQMTDDDPHTIATVEASLREDGGTARELRLVSQQTER